MLTHFWESKNLPISKTYSKLHQIWITLKWNLQRIRFHHRRGTCRNFQSNSLSDSSFEDGAKNHFIENFVILFEHCGREVSGVVTSSVVSWNLTQNLKKQALERKEFERWKWTNLLSPAPEPQLLPAPPPEEYTLSRLKILSNSAFNVELITRGSRWARFVWASE